MKFQTSDQFSIDYTQTDSGCDKNILFIHGNLACKEWWYPSMEKLKASSSQPTQLIAADWRGYGDSKGLTDKGEINFDRYAQDYIELVESLQLKEVHVVGHSTGGMIAMMAILKKPELFGSLTLLDSVGAKGLDLVLPREQVMAHFETMSTNKDYCFQVLAATIQGVDPQSQTFLGYAEKAFRSDKVNFTGVIEELVDNIDFTSEMAKISLPTLILHGENDVVLPMSGSEELKQQLPHAKFEVLENQGHSCNVENPDKFTDHLKSFWANI